ncbi:hypothetical protein LPW41_08400 [Microbacterium sp. JC 701]|uniref:Uncharacterized protein n=1 Tax=Microbacterium algihabitans TaxID=3075992 RepID=A0ABU3RZ09_9MICO|nr:MULTISPECIES: hypothetical protein [unclassified Microbacterium]MCD2169726.1 hypothetical protein [Microbacterium sp. JC 701]MDU0327800.1 hypothetical protein [Microbacterium sp. KSW2-21]
MRTLPDAVGALLQAADADTLLRDADALAEALADAGWAPEVESGRFSADGWDVVSSAWPPNLSVFRDGDLLDVRRDALAIAATLNAEPQRWAFETEGPDWSGWTTDDPRWDDDQIDWLLWHGQGVVVELFTAPAVAGEVPAHLHLAIERADSPPEGLPRDDVRDLRVASEGSIVERWFLVGESDLPDELLATLEADPDQRVSAAAASERRMRDGGFDDPTG